jgi:transposase-like protein
LKFRVEIPLKEEGHRHPHLRSKSDEEEAMAKHRMDLPTFVGKLLEQDDVDALHEGVKHLAQLFMEEEVSAQIGASAYERNQERIAYRNGYRSRTLDTRLGTIELKIPKITRGSYFPSLIEPRRRIDKALYAVVTEAYVKGVSTRKVDDLAGTRHRRDLQVRGQPHLQRPRPGRARV